jgi:hypothetical protein
LVIGSVLAGEEAAPGALLSVEEDEASVELDFL